MAVIGFVQGYEMRNNPVEMSRLALSSMQSTIIQPRAELAGFVSHYWMGTWDIHSQPPNDLYYVLASTTTEMVFTFSGPGQQDDLQNSIIQGHTQTPLQKEVKQYYHILGVSLHSYAIPTLFNLPSIDLNSEHLSLSTFLGAEGELLTEKIASASTTPERIDILNDFFLSLVKKGNMRDPRMVKAIQAIKANYGNQRVIELAEDSFLSQKQFKRRFKDFSGFNPKEYSRIVRMEAALVNYSRFPSLTELALYSGYYDQAHFIREFKELTGYSPKEFMRLGES